MSPSVIPQADYEVLVRIATAQDIDDARYHRIFPHDTLSDERRIARLIEEGLVRAYDTETRPLAGRILVLTAEGSTALKKYRAYLVRLGTSRHPKGSAGRSGGMSALFDPGRLDMTPRYAPTNVMLGGGLSRPVLRAIVHPAGSHPKSPIRDDVKALELVTDRGSRWYGVEDAYINAQLRMVVVGTPKSDEVRMKWPVVPVKFRAGGRGRSAGATRFEKGARVRVRNAKDLHGRVHAVLEGTVVKTRKDGFVTIDYFDPGEETRARKEVHPSRLERV